MGPSPQPSHRRGEWEVWCIANVPLYVFSTALPAIRTRSGRSAPAGRSIPTIRTMICVHRNPGSANGRERPPKRCPRECPMTDTPCWLRKRCRSECTTHRRRGCDSCWETPGWLLAGIFLKHVRAHLPVRTFLAGTHGGERSDHHLQQLREDHLGWNHREPDRRKRQQRRHGQR